MTSKSLASFDTPSEKSTKSHPSVSTTEPDESLLYKPFSGDLSVCFEDTSPNTSTPEGKFSYLKPESSSAFVDHHDQQAATKDTLETIIEGPLESIPEVENAEESYKCDISK